MYGKIQVKPVLKTGKAPNKDIRNVFVRKLLIKYGVLREPGKFSALIFRNMCRMFTGTVGNTPLYSHIVSKNYINYLEIFKSILNLTSKQVADIYNQNTNYLTALTNSSRNLQLYNNTFLIQKQTNNQTGNIIVNKFPGMMKSQPGQRVEYNFDNSIYKNIVHDTKHTVQSSTNNRIENKTEHHVEQKTVSVDNFHITKAEVMQKNCGTNIQTTLRHSLPGTSYLRHISAMSDKTVGIGTAHPLRDAYGTREPRAWLQHMELKPDSQVLTQQLSHTYRQGMDSIQFEKTHEKIKHLMKQQNTKNPPETLEVNDRHMDVHLFSTKTVKATKKILKANSGYSQNPLKEIETLRKDAVDPKTETEKIFAGYSEILQKSVPFRKDANKKGYGMLAAISTIHFKNAFVKGSPHIYTQGISFDEVSEETNLTIEKRIRNLQRVFLQSVEKRTFYFKPGGSAKGIIARAGNSNLEAAFSQENYSARPSSSNYIKNLLHPDRLVYMDEISGKASNKVLDRYLAKVLNNSKDEREVNSFHKQKNEDLVFQRSHIKGRGVSDDGKQNQVQPIEKEACSKSFNTSKEYKDINKLGNDDINLLADRVFKVLEKRMEIRKDRRGLK